MIYKNTGPSAKTFYGVTFEPGEIKEVSGRIKHHKFIQVTSLPKEPPVVTNPPSTKPDKPPVKSKPEEKSKEVKQGTLIKDKDNEPGQQEEVALDTSDESTNDEADKVNEDTSKENKQEDSK